MKKKILGICLAICLCYSQSFAFSGAIVTAVQVTAGIAIVGCIVWQVLKRSTPSLASSLVVATTRLLSSHFSFSRTYVAAAPTLRQCLVRNQPNVGNT
jgi:hypothetical protein